MKWQIRADHYVIKVRREGKHKRPDTVMTENAAEATDVWDIVSLYK